MSRNTVNRKNLGELEEIVLLAVGVLQAEAYGYSITKEILKVTGRKVNMRAIHTTLYRLEDKGFLKSKLSGATNERGGRRKRIFSLTNSGKGAIAEAKMIRMKFWQLLPTSISGK